MSNANKNAGTSKHMKDYMDGRISEKQYTDRMKKETSAIVRSFFSGVEKRNKMSTAR